MEKPVTRKYEVPSMPEAFWGNDSLSCRSEELSPLYVRRYVGPRTLCRGDHHSFWEMTYVFKGSGELDCRGRHSLQPGTGFLIPPGMEHYEHVPLAMDTLWVGLQGRRLGDLYPGRMFIGKIPELHSFFEHLWWMTERYRDRVGPELDGLTLLLVNRFIRLTTEKLDAEPGCINEAIQWMHDHFDQPASVLDLATRFGCSEGYFFRIFKRQTGKTPITYLTEIRVQHAMDALRNTTMTIDKIARLVGYRDPLYFSRVFRKVTGRSPGAVRSGPILHQ